MKNQFWPWEIHYPNGGAIGNFKGGDVRGTCFGIAETACKINKPVTNFNSKFSCGTHHDWYSASAGKIAFDLASTFPFALTGGDVIPMFQWMAAAGNCRYYTVGFGGLIQGSAAVTQGMAIEYDLEWGPLHRRLIHGNMGGLGNYASFMPTVLQDYLNDAPCVGPFNYGPNFSGGFIYSSTDNIEHPERRNTFEEEFRGEYNGLDYMFYHNLFYLLNGSGSQTTDLRYRDIQLPFPRFMAMPLVWPPQYNVYGNNTHPSTIFGYEFVEHSSAVNVLGTINGQDGTGNITVRAGKQIHLQPGWSVENGAFYHAYIQRPQCSSIHGTVQRLNGDSTTSDYLTDDNYLGNTDGIVREPIITDDSLQIIPIPDELYAASFKGDSLRVKEIIDSLNAELIAAYGTVSDEDLADPTSDYSLYKAVEIFPNPNAGKFELQLSGLSDEETVDVMILDALGQMIYKKDHIFPNEPFSFDLSSEGKGVYFVKVISVYGRTSVKKVVVE